MENKEMLDFFSSFDENENDIKTGDSICPNCNNLGFVGRPCTLCGRIKEDNTPVKVAKQVEKYKNTDFAFIPSDFDSEWKESLILRELGTAPEYSSIIKEMSLVHNNLKKGVLPNYSMLIAMPKDTSKKTWAYSCMRIAKEAGFTVAPLIDTLEFKRLSILGGERPKYKLYNAVEYDDYMSADFLVMTVVKNNYCTEAFAEILTLLDRRSRLNKATIILSSMETEYLSRRDFTRSFKYILKKGLTNPSLSVPKLLEFFEE